MPYDPELEIQVDGLTAMWRGLEKKKMFGGICYLLGGHMALGVWKDYLIVRAGPEKTEEKLKLEYTKSFDITGKAVKGWVMVEKKALKKNGYLKEWLELGRSFAKTLPKK